VRLWHLDWEPEAAAATTVGEATATSSGATARVRVAAATATTRPTLREDLRRSAPAPVPVLPQAAAAVTRLPWKRVLVGAAAVASVVLALIATRRPATRVRLSPYMAQAVPAELDLVDPAPFLAACTPGDYERHLESLRSGHPDARDIACLSAHGAEPALVSAVLDGAPLTAADALASHRLRRNAASALSAVSGDAARDTCRRLGDERDEVRSVAAAALGVTTDEAASGCLAEVVRSGGAAEKASAAKALRQRLARRLVSVEDGWRLLQVLLQDPQPEAREAGLSLVSLFAAAVADPAVRRLLQDPDPGVAGTAQKTLEEIARIHQTDLLRGDNGS
jgi:hypothetical protein